MNRNASVRLVRDPTVELLEQFSALLITDGYCMCDVQASALVHSVKMPWFHIALATPNDGEHCFKFYFFCLGAQ